MNLNGEHISSCKFRSISVHVSAGFESLYKLSKFPFMVIFKEEILKENQRLSINIV